eukprot:2557505-Rhodomonas_salina.1
MKNLIDTQVVPHPYAPTPSPYAPTHFLPMFRRIRCLCSYKLATLLKNYVGHGVRVAQADGTNLEYAATERCMQYVVLICAMRLRYQATEYGWLRRM